MLHPRPNSNDAERGKTLQFFRADAQHRSENRLVACMLWSGNEAAVKRCASLDRGEDTLMDVNSVLAESLGVVDDVEAIFAGYVHLPRIAPDTVPDCGS